SSMDQPSLWIILANVCAPVELRVRTRVRKKARDIALCLLLYPIRGEKSTHSRVITGVKRAETRFL
ncbi:MAG: hypothetical protein IKC56_00785, partial [Clostridia bacterium]|nr:hypothetical protein [Clostridia bacterium]